MRCRPTSSPPDSRRPASMSTASCSASSTGWRCSVRTPTRSSFCPKTTARAAGATRINFPSRLLGSSGDKAFLITVPAIDAFRKDFQLNNMWEKSLDYRRFPVTVNGTPPATRTTARSNRREPHRSGLGQLISTAHHDHGTWGLRYNQVVEDIPPTIELIDV